MSDDTEVLQADSCTREKSIQALGGSRRAIDVAALTDPQTPVESLAGAPTTRN